MFKRMLEAYHMAKDFELKMNMLSKTIKKEKRFKVSVTEKQLGILEYCASSGIDTIHDLRLSQL